MKLSQAGLDLIKSFEGFRSKPYKCPAGRWTIGYGSTAGVNANSPPITREQGDTLLLKDLARYEKCVLDNVHVPTHQYQYDALVSFCYNVGCGSPKDHPKGPSGFRGSTLLLLLNKGDYAGAAKEFDKWNKGGGHVLKGLVRRRAAERRMFEGAMVNA